MTEHMEPELSTSASATALPVPGPTPFFEESLLAKMHAERDLQLRALGKAAGLANSLGAAIDALKGAVARHDIELATPSRAKVEILSRRLTDALADPAALRAFNATADAVDVEQNGSN